MKKIIIFLLASIMLVWCGRVVQEKIEENISNQKTMENTNLKNAYFAGGCFWCMEWIFEWQQGVSQAISGYIWWSKETANYSQIGRWDTGHREWVQVIYDPEIIEYSKLVELFWTQIDPTDAWGQFADRWFHYTTAIYYSTEEEKGIAESSKKALEDSDKFNEPIVTSILEVTPFYRAEEHHQDYAKKQTLRYKAYEKWSGRKDFKEDNWKEKREELEKTSKFSSQPSSQGEWVTQNYLWEPLTELQYKVTQKAWTERSFDNKYWDNKREWIYVDIIDGTPLYSSLDKFKSWTGWPSFTKAINEDNITEKADNKFFMKRTEIVWAKSGAHIGHVFNDWPPEKWWMRHCMNSAAMKFIEVKDLEEAGYWEYLKDFQ